MIRQRCKMEKGQFIVFEGIDGAGKTTQVRLLADALENMGKRVYITAEPTSMPTGRDLRRVLSGEVKKSDSEIAAMFALDRMAHNLDPIDGIEKMISDGYVIICDRYYYSSLAYQGSCIDYDWVKSLNVNCPDIRRPDLCIFLDLAPEESMRRIGRGRDSTEIYENIDTLSRVRASFMRVFDDLASSDDIEIIDASGTVEDVSAKVVCAVSQRL